MTPGRVDALQRGSDWAGVRVVVAGFGRDGFACADNLNHLGASVVALDEPDTGTDTGGGDRAERAELLEVLGARVRLEPGSTATLPDDTDLLVVTPGWHLGGPLLEQARERGVPVWGEVELAWRLRDPSQGTAWLVVAGDGLSGPVVDMLASILRAAGGRSEVVGASGLPVVEAVMDPERYDALVVRLDASRLRHCGSMSAQAAVVLGGERGTGGITGLARAYEHVQVACVYDAADPDVELLVREADVVEGARAIGCTLGMPGVGMLGLVEDILADRAFIEARHTSAAELCTVPDLPDDEPRTVAAALVAAALARAHGVARSAVREGLRGYAGRAAG